MSFLQAVFLGAVEGITEFLPISSTGHLVLTGHLLGLAQTDFLKSFEIAIQLGAILSVVVLYWRSLVFDREAVKRVLAAFLPTAVAGLFLYQIVKSVFLESNVIVLWALGIGGLLLILFEMFHRERDGAVQELAAISYLQALAIGLFQSIAMVPGVSRAAATILGGLLVGLKRKTVVEFSFLLAVPTMLAATALDLFKNAHSFSLGEFDLLLVGFFVSFVVALFTVQFLLRFIQRHTFISFGVYRIAVALLFWLVVLRP